MENKEPKKQNTKNNNKSFKIDIKKMGVDIDKNEYQEIILSNSNHPENLYNKYR